MKKLVALFSILVSGSSFASMDFTCVGENESETIAFYIDDPEALQITSVSEALCGGKTSIEKEEDGVSLSRIDLGPRSRSVEFTTWQGNRGYTLRLPLSITEGSEEQTFRATYEFAYDDVSKLKVERHLDCKRTN